MTTRMCIRLLACGVAAAGAGRGATAQPTITSLGVLPDGNSSFAYGVSADGLVVTGSAGTTGGGRAVRWTAAGGLQNLGLLATGGTYSSGSALSADGAVVVGINGASGNANRAFRWTPAGGMLSLGVLGTGSASAANAVSADGSVVAGFSYTAGFTAGRAFRWTAATGMQSLGVLAGGDAPNAFGLSGDGSVVVGACLVDGLSRAFRWTAGSGMQDLGVLPGADSSDALAVSGDGAVVTGDSGDQFNGTYLHAIRWTQAGGLQDLGVLDGGTVSQGFALTGDGSVIVGVSGSASGDRAVLWTAALGLVDLNTYLPSRGVNLAGWTLTAARGLSAGGSVIVGYGTLDGANRGFVVSGLPACGPPVISAQPASAIACRTGTAAFSVAAAGTGPFTYLWQVQTGPGVWMSLGNDPGPLPCGTGAFAYATPINSPSVNIGIRACPGETHYQVRALVTGAAGCGSAASAEATYTVCLADFDCNDEVEPADVSLAVNTWFASLQQGTLAGDLDGSGAVEPGDIAFFVAAWFHAVSNGC